jgi:hypothetical protein
MRPKLFFYNITKEPKTDKGFRYWMKYKLGQKPVLLGMSIENSIKILLKTILRIKAISMQKPQTVLL